VVLRLALAGRRLAVLASWDHLRPRSVTASLMLSLGTAMALRVWSPRKMR
jgi:hypothetical protein